MSASQSREFFGKNASVLLDLLRFFAAVAVAQVVFVGAALILLDRQVRLSRVAV